MVKKAKFGSREFWWIEVTNSQEINWCSSNSRSCVSLKKFGSEKKGIPRFSTIFVLYTRVNPTTSFVPHRWPPISGHGKISRVFSVFSPWLRPRIGAKRGGERSWRKEKGSFSKGCTPSFFSSSSIFHHLPSSARKTLFTLAAMDTQSGRLIDILPPPSPRLYFRSSRNEKLRFLERTWRHGGVVPLVDKEERGGGYEHSRRFLRGRVEHRISAVLLLGFFRNRGGNIVVDWRTVVWCRSFVIDLSLEEIWRVIIWLWERGVDALAFRIIIYNYS